MKFVCFGEIMARFNPHGYYRLAQSNELEFSFGGGEANVAVALSRFGKDVAFATKVPNNELAKCALASLKMHGVDISNVAFGGDRLGLYFLEMGASQRPSKVIYDRKYSSVSMAEKENFDWRNIFAEAEWFHFTGITPALSDSCAQICLEACVTAKEMGVTISCDLNYCKDLWTSKKAEAVMSTLIPYIDVLIANEEDCEMVFGLGSEKTDIENSTPFFEGYKTVIKKLAERFDLHTVAITLRENLSASDNSWSAMLYNQNEFYFSKKYNLHIVDRVGGGDSFGAGLIYALSEGMDNQSVIEFAVAASALKHSICGDYNEIRLEEVKNLMGGDGSGRVQR